MVLLQNSEQQGLCIIYNACIGMFMVVYSTRDIEAGYFMMEGTVNIPISITEGSRALPYTYAVCEYQNPDVVSCYEYLYNCPDSGKGNVSRCLIIPTAYSHGMQLALSCAVLCIS